MRFTWTLLIIGLTLLGCGLTAAQAPAVTPDLSAAQLPMGAIVTVTPAEGTATPALTSTAPTNTAIPAPTATPSACVTGNGSPIEYDFDAQIDANTRSANVQMRAAYRNLTTLSLDRIVFNIDANRTPGTFTFDAISVEAPYILDRYTLNSARLEVILISPLPANCEIVFILNFSVVVPPLAEARMKYFSATDSQINFGHWLPEFAPYRNGLWYTPKAWTIGEYISSERADFRARVMLSGRPDQTLIGPGDVVQEAIGVWTFDFRAGRSFPLVVATDMARLTALSADGLQIDLYFLRGRTPEATALHALNVAKAAAERYTALFGPTPYRRFVVVEGDFPDGMEFSGLVFVGHQWFAGYVGKVDSWLTLITAHEIAHQWWYALVMTDQGDAPYLDESLALYCELLYLEGAHPDLVSWWWGFRVNVHQPQGYVDSPVYDYDNTRLYINAVYLRGAQMLKEIRDRIGSEAFIGWWQAYIRNAGARVVGASVFWEALGATNYTMIADIRLKYLRNPEVINSPSTAPQNTPSS